MSVVDESNLSDQEQMIQIRDQITVLQKVSPTVELINAKDHYELIFQLQLKLVALESKVSCPVQPEVLTDAPPLSEGEKKRLEDRLADMITKMEKLDSKNDELQVERNILKNNLRRLDSEVENLVYKRNDLSIEISSVQEALMGFAV